MRNINNDELLRRMREQKRRAAATIPVEADPLDEPYVDVRADVEDVNDSSMQRLHDAGLRLQGYIGAIDGVAGDVLCIRKEQLMQILDDVMMAIIEVEKSI